jgi:hypothetical protein
MLGNVLNVAVRVVVQVPNDLGVDHRCLPCLILGYNITQPTDQFNPLFRGRTTCLGRRSTQTCQALHGFPRYTGIEFVDCGAFVAIEFAGEIGGSRTMRGDSWAIARGLRIPDATRRGSDRPEAIAPPAAQVDAGLGSLGRILEGFRRST